MNNCITHHHACDCREAHFKDFEEALNRIAAWHDGPVVTSLFDEPGSAQIARDVLKKGEINELELQNRKMG